MAAINVYLPLSPLAWTSVLHPFNSPV